jgi:hypothetical protein
MVRKINISDKIQHDTKKVLYIMNIGIIKWEELSIKYTE